MTMTAEKLTHKQATALNHYCAKHGLTWQYVDRVLLLHTAEGEELGFVWPSRDAWGRRELCMNTYGYPRAEILVRRAGQLAWHV
jgi:hypothetical protein